MDKSRFPPTVGFSTNEEVQNFGFNRITKELNYKKNILEVLLLKPKKRHLSFCTKKMCATIKF